MKSDFFVCVVCNIYNINRNDVELILLFSASIQQVLVRRQDTLTLLYKLFAFVVIHQITDKHDLQNLQKCTHQQPKQW